MRETRNVSFTEYELIKKLGFPEDTVIIEVSRRQRIIYINQPLPETTAKNIVFEISVPTKTKGE